MPGSSLILLVVFGCMAAAGYLATRAVAHLIPLYQERFTKKAESRLEQMFVFVDYRKAFLVNLAAMLSIPLIAWWLTGSWFYALLALGGVLAAPRLMMLRLAKVRRKKLIAGLPDALAQVAGSMRSGSTFSASIENLVNETQGPISQEFALMLKEQKLGISAQEALENLAERIRAEEIDLIVTATLIARDVGGNLAETFERLSLMLRRKLEMEAKIVALTSQGKMQGWVVALLPFAIIAALVFIEPESTRPIFTTYLGWMFLAAILVLEGMGAMFIRKIVNIDV